MTRQPEYQICKGALWLGIVCTSGIVYDDKSMGACRMALDMALYARGYRDWVGFDLVDIVIITIYLRRLSATKWSKGTFDI